MSAAALTFAGDGGAVQAVDGLYLKRQADRDADERIASGGLWFVLDSRQVGKSSLLIRALQDAEAAGVRVVYEDLSTVCATEPRHLFASMAGNLGLDGDAFAGLADDRIADRFQEMAVESAVGDRLLLLLDEVDAIMSCAARSSFLRALENMPGNFSIGVAGMGLPADLSGEQGPGPLVRERRVFLRDFTLAELQPAEILLHRADAHVVVERVWYWTSGHPFLTMNLLAKVQETGEDVDAAVERLYLNQPADHSRNLYFVETQLERGCLPLYRRLLKGEAVSYNASEDVQRLLLSGIAVRDGDALRVRNRLYQTYFDEKRLALIEGAGPFETPGS